jgi:hypothetical protein
MNKTYQTSICFSDATKDDIEFLKERYRASMTGVLERLVAEAARKERGPVPQHRPPPSDIMEVPYDDRAV